MILTACFPASSLSEGGFAQASALMACPEGLFFPMLSQNSETGGEVPLQASIGSTIISVQHSLH